LFFFLFFDGAALTSGVNVAYEWRGVYAIKMGISCSANFQFIQAIYLYLQDKHWGQKQNEIFTNI